MNFFPPMHARITFWALLFTVGSELARAVWQSASKLADLRNPELLEVPFGDFLRILAGVGLSFSLPLSAATNSTAPGSRHTLTIAGAEIRLNGEPIKIKGLRMSAALMSDDTARDLIDHLDLFRSYGVNTISVYIMGSRFTDVKGYRPDATLDPVHGARLSRIIEAADARNMIVLVGCLYWGTSRAREELAHWTQADANRAIANTVAWLKGRNHRNVFVDPDNEGMANAARNGASAK